MSDVRCGFEGNLLIFALIFASFSPSPIHVQPNRGLKEISQIKISMKGAINGRVTERTGRNHENNEISTNSFDFEGGVRTRPQNYLTEIYGL